MKLAYCENCEKNVNLKKKEFSWVVFFLFFGIGYVAYRWLFQRKKYCPICGMKVK